MMRECSLLKQSSTGKPAGIYITKEIPGLRDDEK